MPNGTKQLPLIEAEEAQINCTTEYYSHSILAERKKRCIFQITYIYVKSFSPFPFRIFCFLLHASNPQTILCCFFLYLEDWIFDIMDKHSLKAAAPAKDNIAQVSKK